MKLHCVLITDDGGKTWTVANSYYLAPTYYGESRGVLNATAFQNMKLVKLDSSS
jgi:hypothetical protein